MSTTWAANAPSRATAATLQFRVLKYQATSKKSPANMFGSMSVIDTKRLRSHAIRTISMIVNAAMKSAMFADEINQPIMVSYAQQAPQPHCAAPRVASMADRRTNQRAAR